LYYSRSRAGAWLEEDELELRELYNTCKDSSGMYSTLSTMLV